MKKAIRSIVVIAGMASAVAFGSQFAQAHEGKECCHQEMEHHGHSRHHQFAKTAAKLGLSEQQQIKMKEIFKQNREQAKPVLARLLAEKRGLRALIHADKTDEAAIRAQAAKIAGIEGDRAVQQSRMIKQMRAILTPEQAEKFKSLQKEREQRFEKFHDHFGKRWEKTDKD